MTSPMTSPKVRLGVPAGVVELKHDDAIPSRPSLAGKQGQQRGKETASPTMNRDLSSIAPTPPKRRLKHDPSAEEILNVNRP